MLSRSKKGRGNDSDLSKRSQMYLDSSQANNKQYKILSAVGLISIIVILVLYKVGLFSASKSKSEYIVGTRTQRIEESTNKILSAWGQSGEALKFANLPSSGQGYLSVNAMVVQQGTNII